MSALFANNASSRSPIDIQSADVTLKTMPGEGVKFPQPSAGDFFMVTLEDRRTGQIEICRCTGRSGDQLNVVRAQEGTTAQHFFLGTTISNRITAGTVTAFAGVPEVPEIPAGKIYGRSYLAWIETITKATYDTHLVTQDTRDDAQDVRMDGLTSKNGQQDTRLDLIEQTDADQNAAINANTVKNAEQDGRLTNAENKNTAQDGRLDAVEAKNATQDGRLDANDAKNTSQDAAIAAVKQFPEAPNDGQAYGRKNLNWTDVTEEAPADGLGYMRKNGAWTPSTGGATTSDTPPPPPLQNGQLWWESDTGDLFLYYDDGNSAQWVQVNNAGDALAWVDYLPPASPAQGQLWWRTDNGHLYVRYDDGNSQQWVDTTANGAVDLSQYTLKTAQARNRIINGAMQIAQETIAAVGSGGYPVDQFTISSSIGTVTAVRQPTSGPDTIPAMATSLSTGKPSLIATDNWQLYQPIEGAQLTDLVWGKARAKPLVARFSAYTNQAGTYTFRIGNGALDRFFMAPFTLPANAWTEIVIPVPPDTTGTWTVGNVAGMYVYWGLAAGANYNAGVAGWQGTSQVQIAGQTNLAQAAGNAFYITSVGLYADPDNTGRAPPFETPNVTDELARCQRYWFTDRIDFNTYGVAAQADTRRFGFPTSMRTTPTITEASISAGNCTLNSFDSLTSSGFRIWVQVTGTGSLYRSSVFMANARM